MKKIIILTILAVALATGLIIFKRAKQQTHNAAYTVGIVQTASHPALDAVCEGFVQELTNKMGNTVAFITQNAQGSVTQAHSIAQQFHANRTIQSFFAIATPAAQAMHAVEKERPIIIAAVTDPATLGLIYPTTNVCGVKDMIDVASEIEMLMQLVPQAQTVGLIYTAGEANSLALVKQMQQELAARGLTPTDFAIGSEADVQAIVELACRKTDVLLAPTDNTVASAITTIAHTALKYKKPLIVSDNMLVKFGALAARGVDYKTSGKRAAQIAYEVMVEGKKPYTLPVEQAHSQQIYINQKTLTSLGLSMPEKLQKDVIFVS
jgi:putative ABC transport system substrate-binding protein